MKIALVSCPSWSVSFPPYNLSLLKAILKNNGHEAKNFDFNMQAYEFLKEDEINFWEGQNFFYWEGKLFDEKMLPKISSLMDKEIDTILEYNPEFIGFSLYHTSIRCATHMIERIRQRDSSKKIMIGGPQCFAAGEDHFYQGLADYIITGEGEEAILKALECPDKKAIPSPKLTRINELPVPDYEDYDLMKYTRQMGTSLEASRGCTAKCAFCIETHYWAYRSKKAEKIIEEMKECIEKYGARDFRFNDSLVNGNIKEFYRFVDQLSRANLNILWDGYARINGKMDLPFMHKIKKSGNSMLSYGVESGSQKVLDDMRKGITVAEIEQNLEDGTKAKLYNHVNWMVGFPSENVLDNLYSLIFVHNNGKYINNICPGMTCGIGDKAGLQVHAEKFDILPEYYWGNFVTKDFKNTAINRFIRLKTFHIWLDLLKVFNGQQHGNLSNHYSIMFLDKKVSGRIEQGICVDFSYMDKDFKSRLHAEFVSFFWAVYKVFGPLVMNLHFYKDGDIEEFGTVMAKGYDATVNFQVDKDGKWKMKLDHSLETVRPFSERVELEGDYGVR